jgi:hypothetical protein
MEYDIEDERLQRNPRDKADGARLQDKVEQWKRRLDRGQPLPGSGDEAAGGAVQQRQAARGIDFDKNSVGAKSSAHQQDQANMAPTPERKIENANLRLFLLPILMLLGCHDVKGGKVQVNWDRTWQEFLRRASDKHGKRAEFLWMTSVKQLQDFANCTGTTIQGWDIFKDLVLQARMKRGRSASESPSRGGDSGKIDLTGARSTGTQSAARSQSAQSHRHVIEIDSPAKKEGERSAGFDRVASNDIQDALSESASQHIAKLEVSC